MDELEIKLEQELLEFEKKDLLDYHSIYDEYL